jgi:GNAT superfamily N-acetyltransferase
VDLTIRDALAADAAAIADLLGQLGSPNEPAAVTARLERLVIVGDRVVVAELAGVVVGLAHLHVSPTIELDRPAAKLGSLVVSETHRRQGIGRALVDAAENEARLRGSGVFYVTTSERRDETHRFYESLGLEQTGRRYGRTLSQ